MDTLDPDFEPGRLTLISRMGAAHVEEKLPPLLEGVRESGRPVVWACDPPCTATPSPPNGLKTRHFDDVLAEIAGFFRARTVAETWPGGVHIELTGDDVTECLGGSTEIHNEDLDTHTTMCDPRLNAQQSLNIWRSASPSCCAPDPPPGPRGRPLEPTHDPPGTAGC